MRALGRIAATIAVVAVGWSLAPADAANAAVELPRVERVLVVSIPGLEWTDVRPARMPALAALSDESGIALLSTRIGHRRASLGDAYVTMGAGTRAIAVENDGGYAFAVDETVGGGPAADLYTERTGQAPQGAIVQISIRQLQVANEESDYEATPGMLGGALDAAGVARAVVANADRREVALDAAPTRAAVTMLMDEEGNLGLGAVDPGLLVADPAAPFGQRLDPGRVDAAFRAAWDPAGPRVVLVEASDSVRAEKAIALTAPGPAQQMRADALARADALLARLLDGVDPDRDAVIVLGLPVSAARPALGVVAVRAPGVGPGLLQSALTRRAGYVAMADVGPTIMDLVGAVSDVSREGRSIFLAQRGPAGQQRQHDLEEAVRDAQFRDRALAPYAVALGLAGLGVLVPMLLGRLPRFRRALAEIILAAVAAGFLVSMVRAARHSSGPFLLGLVAVSALLVTAARLADRRDRGAGVLVLLGAIVATLVLDLLTGAHLQLNSMFGYSAEIGGRFAGIGNLAFAVLAPSALILAVRIVGRGEGRGPVYAAIAILVVTVLVEGLPFFGADVGGVVSMVPAYTCAMAILLGIRLRVVHVAGILLGTGALVTLFGVIDLMRPARDRAHLARLAEQVRDGGPGWIITTLGRRWTASFGGPVTSVIAAVAAIAIVIGAFYAVRRLNEQSQITQRLARSIPADLRRRALLVGLVILGVLGLFLNDSSVAVPALMLIPIVCAMAIPEPGTTPTAAARPDASSPVPVPGGGR